MGTELSPDGMVLTANPAFSHAGSWTFEGPWQWTGIQAEWPNRFASAGDQVQQAVELQANTEYRIYIDAGSTNDQRTIRVNIGDVFQDIQLRPDVMDRFTFLLTPTAGNVIGVEVTNANPGTTVLIDNFYVFGIPDGNLFYDLWIGGGYGTLDTMQMEEFPADGGFGIVRGCNRKDRTNILIKYTL